MQEREARLMLARRARTPPAGVNLTEIVTRRCPCFLSTLAALRVA